LSVSLACVLLAGCGGSTPQAPSYATAGNAICTEQAAQLGVLRKPATVEQAVAYLPSALAIMRRETARLGALDASGSPHARLDAALASTRALTALLARLLHELRGGMVELGELAAVQTQTTALRAQVDARFRQAGLPRCAA
jgi:hypothetical protein